MSASREQIAPLALSSPQSLTGEEGEAEVASKRSRLRSVRRRRCLICGGCCGVSLVVLAVVIVVLAFTVFRVRDPEITINGLTLQRVAVGPPSALSQQFFSLNLTLLVDLSVKNPNAASVRFGPSTTTVYFHERRLGEAYGPAGNSRAHRTFRMNVTVDIMAERVMADAQLLQELVGGVIDVTTSTRLGGRVKLLGVIRRHVDVSVNCSLAIEVASQSLQQQNCDREVRL